MKLYNVTASARMHAPAALVYSIIADYRNGHPFILPKPPFIAQQVEQGGIGAGTIISFQMRLFGTVQSFRAAVTEPHPGQVLVETNLETGGAVTTFLVIPIDHNRHTEQQARAQGYDINSATFPFQANGKAHGLGDYRGFVKLISDTRYGELLGAHMIGPDVTELLPELTLARQAELTVDDIARNVHAHPTLSEAIQEAAHGIAGQMIHV